MAKKVKIYEYNVDHFIRGRVAARSPKGVRRHLRSLFGWITYWKIRKYLIITEAKE